MPATPKGHLRRWRNYRIPSIDLTSFTMMHCKPAKTQTFQRTYTFIKTKWNMQIWPNFNWLVVIAGMHSFAILAPKKWFFIMAKSGASFSKFEQLSYCPIFRPKMNLSVSFYFSTKNRRSMVLLVFGSLWNSCRRSIPDKSIEFEVKISPKVPINADWNFVRSLNFLAFEHLCLETFGQLKLNFVEIFHM